MSPKASDTSFFSALGKDDDTEDEVPRRRKTTPAPGDEQDTTAQRPVPETNPATGDQPLPSAPQEQRKKRRRPEPVHKISVDVFLSLVDGLSELYERDRRGPKAEINDAIRAHLEKNNITVEPWEG